MVNNRHIQSPLAPEQQGPGRPKGSRRWQGRFAVMTGICLLFVLYGSWVPFNFQPASGDKAWYWLLGPERTAGGFSLTDTVANVLLTIPLGFFAMAAMAPAGKAKHPLAAIAAVLTIALLGALTAEIGQVFLPGRLSSLRDVISQMGGAVTGIFGFALLGTRIYTRLAELDRTDSSQSMATKLLVGYAAALIACQLIPFAFTLDLGLLWDKVQAGQIHFVPLTDLRPDHAVSALSKVLMIVPVGYLARLAVTAPHRPTPPLAADLIGLAVAGIIEMGQVLVLTRHATTTDLIWGWLGTRVGIWLAGRVGLPCRENRT